MSILTLSGSPHIQTDRTVRGIMFDVVIAMVPALLVSFWFFGLGAIKVTLVAVIACILFEWVITKYILKARSTISDGSAIVTGILLAFNLPSSLPVWMIVIGSLVAIGVAKMSFGGLGKNPFNPAIVGRIFLMISFPVDMTMWPKPIESRWFLSFNNLDKTVLDSITGPTPLGLLKGGKMEELPGYVDLLLGNMGGSIGEISAAALMIGALYMLYRRVISWHIPVSYLGSVIVFTGILWLVDPTIYVDPLFHLVTGGLMLGAFYMATDMVTSPMSGKGMLIFGIGCGVLTIVIRVFGAYPEGVSFAILIMNLFVPLINRSMKPKRFGEVVNNG
ncbi:MAG: RnfABCDGE type electron transport complex subunit D [Bacteroidales bacterium]